MMRWALAVLLAAAWPAAANDVYKCVTNGKTVYQNTPCEAQAQQKQLKADKSGAVLGCYTIGARGFEGMFEVKRGPRDDLRLEFGPPERRNNLPLKVATASEIKFVSDAFRVPVTEGASVNWDASASDTRPIGLYKGRNEMGQEQLFAYFFYANGPATRMACP